MNTARDELLKILAAINSRDEKNFLARVDLQQLMDVAYDEATDVLVDNCDKFHKLYPKDLFFKFGPRINGAGGSKRGAEGARLRTEQIISDLRTAMSQE